MLKVLGAVLCPISLVLMVVPIVLAHRLRSDRLHKVTLPLLRTLAKHVSEDPQIRLQIDTASTFAARRSLSIKDGLWERRYALVEAGTATTRLRWDLVSVGEIFTDERTVVSASPSGRSTVSAKVCRTNDRLTLRFWFSAAQYGAAPYHAVRLDDRKVKWCDERPGWRDQPFTEFDVVQKGEWWVATVHWETPRRRETKPFDLRPGLLERVETLLARIGRATTRGIETPRDSGATRAWL